MIRLSRPAASGPHLVVYEDASDPATLHYLPRFAELCPGPGGGVRLEQRTFRSGGAAGPGISAYNWVLRGVVPAGEMEALAGEAEALRGHPVSLRPAPVWPMSWSAGVVVLSDEPREPLACRASVMTDDLAEVFVMLAVRDSDEPALAERLMGGDGLEVGLELKVTGAATPFRGTLRIHPGEMARRLRASAGGAALVSRARAAAEVEAALEDGTLALRVEAGAPDHDARVEAATRRVLERTCTLRRFPAARTWHPTLHGAWFAVADASDRWETLDVVEHGLETRALPVTACIRSVPASAFHGLDGAYQEITPGLARGFARQGIHLPAAAPRPAAAPAR